MIQVKKDTVTKLKRLKDYNRESYDEVINKLIESTGSEMLTERDIEDIKQGLEDIRAGRTIPIHKVASNLGVKLRG
ncbi:hypothetical protein HYX10_01855 [Candidatus Woesearchaeota archaeon]|nr:hypothetical protein [Candidatus Woesearchaeota archaeon]